MQFTLTYYFINHIRYLISFITHFSLLLVILIEAYVYFTKKKIHLLSSYIIDLNFKQTPFKFILFIAILIFFLKYNIFIYIYLMWIIVYFIQTIRYIICINKLFVKNTNIIIKLDVQKYNKCDLSFKNIAFLIFFILPNSIAFLTIYNYLNNTKINKFDILLRMLYFKFLNIGGLTLRISFFLNTCLYNSWQSSNYQNKKIYVRPLIWLYTIINTFTFEINKALMFFFILSSNKKITILYKKIILNNDELLLTRKIIFELFNFSKIQSQKIAYYHGFPHKIIDKNNNIFEKGSSLVTSFTLSKNIWIPEKKIFVQTIQDNYFEKKQFLIVNATENELIKIDEAKSFIKSHNPSNEDYFYIGMRENLRQLMSCQHPFNEILLNKVDKLTISSLNELKNNHQFSFSTEKKINEEFPELFDIILKHTEEIAPYYKEDPELKNKLINCVLNNIYNLNKNEWSEILIDAILIEHNYDDRNKTRELILKYIENFDPK